tara:strand:- start:1736 stop:2155 length:420 start_codon:yes stop_codon:yes gene_type:complete
MAGENTIDVSQYPDQFQTLSVVVTGVGATLADSDDFPLYYAERDTVVDSVFFISATADANDTFQLKRLDAAATDPDSAGSNLTGQQIINAAYTPVDAVVSTTENYIPAGSMIALNVEAGSTGDEHSSITVVIRFRTRLK